MLTRDTDLAAWQTAYVGVGGAFEGFLRLAGDGALADRLRAAVRRAASEESTPEVPMTPEE